MPQPWERLYVGDTEAVAAYAGTEKVWEAETPEPLPEGLTARWRFDGTVDDDVKGTPLALSTATLVDAPGRPGQALAADGSTGTADTADATLNRVGYTVAFRLYTPPTTAMEQVAFTADGAGVVILYFQWRAQANRIYRVLRHQTVRVVGGVSNLTQIAVTASGDMTIPAAAWVHLVGTFDGTTQSMYFNGVLSATDTREFAVVTDPEAFRISVAGGALIDDVTIWDHALTAEEVAALAAG